MGPWLGWFTLTEFLAKGSGAPRLTRESVATTAKLWGEGVIRCHAAWSHGFGKSGFSWIFYNFLVFSVIIVRLEDLYIDYLLCTIWSSSHSGSVWNVDKATFGRPRFQQCFDSVAGFYIVSLYSRWWWEVSWFELIGSLQELMDTIQGLVWKSGMDEMIRWEDEMRACYLWMTMCLWSHVFKKAMTNRSPAQKRTLNWKLT